MRILLAAIAAFATAGCLSLHSDQTTTPVAEITAPMARIPPGRAVIIYGFTPHPNMKGLVESGRSVARVSREEKKWIGNCNGRGQTDPKYRMTAQDERHVAFLVPAGDYAPIWFTLPKAPDSIYYDTMTFRIPEGAVVYLGVFGWDREAALKRQYDYERRIDMAAATALATSLGLPAPVLAEPVLVRGLGDNCWHGTSVFG